MVNGRKLKTCPHCGQLIPPRPLFANAWIKQRIYEFISKHPEGVSCKAVAEFVYSGAAKDQSVIPAHIAQMTPTLARAGVVIRSTGGPYARYRLVKL